MHLFRRVKAVLSDEMEVPRRMEMTRVTMEPPSKEIPDTMANDIVARQTQLDEYLSDDLIAKMVPMMDFPAMFKFRSVSRQWQNRFLPAADLVDEDEKLLAKSFQTEVVKLAEYRRVCFPVYISKRLWLAYNSTSNKWSQQPLMLSFIPEELLFDAKITDHFQFLQERTVDAGLVFVTRTLTDQKEGLIVAKIFRRTWKKLPPRPGLLSPYPGVASCGTTACSGIDYGENVREIMFWSSNRFVRDSSAGYKVIFLTQKLCRCEGMAYFASMYKSTTNAWTITKLPLRVTWPLKNCHYLDSAFYMTSTSEEPGVESLFAINTEDGTIEILPFTCHGNHQLDFSHYKDLVIWDGQLFMLLYRSDVRYPEINVHILKMDLEAREVVEVNSGPPASFISGLTPIRRASVDAMWQSWRIKFLFIDSQRLFFQQSWVSNVYPVVVYDLLKNEWSWLFKSPTPFQPEKWVVEVPRMVAKDMDLLREMYNIRNCEDLTWAKFDPFWQV